MIRNADLQRASKWLLVDMVMNLTMTKIWMIAGILAIAIAFV